MLPGLFPHHLEEIETHYCAVLFQLLTWLWPLRDEADEKKILQRLKTTQLPPVFYDAHDLNSVLHY